MAFDQTAIEDAVRAAFVTASGLADDHVIHEDGSGPAPSEPYLTLNVWTTLVPNTMFDEERLTDNDGEIERDSSDQMFVSVNAYGPGALGLAKTTIQGLQREAVAEALLPSGLAFYSAKPPRNLTALQNVAYQQRAQFDAVFGLTTSTTESVGWIGAATINGTVGPGGGTSASISSTVTS